jgi:hemoglobin
MKLNIVAPEIAEASVARTGQGEDLHVQALHGLLTTFYDSIAQDALLAPYFAVVDMDAHMPRIVAFWETLVFDAHTYSGNAFKPHLAMAGLTADHFARWVSTLERTVDAAFAGPRAERMKFLGHRIAYSMQLRLGITPFGEWREDREEIDR